LADAVKSTLGPEGKFVGIESESQIGGMTMTKDGVTVASSINLPKSNEDLAVRMFRQTAQMTANSAGDGTTTSVVIAEAIINAYDDESFEDCSVTEITRHIQRMSKDIIKNLDKKSKKLTGGRLVDVASISANNDKDLGSLIAEGYKHVGKTGLVSVAQSKTSDTHLEKINGIRVERGYTSKYYVTDKRRNECVLENAYVFVTDQEVPGLKQIQNILEYCIARNKPILIIGEMSLAAAQAVNYNVVQGALKACNIIPPSFGFRREEMLRDICTITGAKFLSESTGNDWGAINSDVLGKIDKVIASDVMTILINEEQNEATKALIDDLNEKLKTEIVEGKKEVLMDRLSCVSGKAAILHVGGLTDIEIKEKKDRVDDSVLATRAAVEDGILPGGGIALLREAQNIKVQDGEDLNEIAAANILQTAIEQPFRQILINAGLDKIGVEDEVTKDGANYQYGYDSKKRKFGDMYKMGIIDPTKVTKSSLQNAVSVATTILMCETVITNMRENESVE
jgi:chaperonin GroEL